MPNYDWRCQVCDSVNPGSSIACNSCGCPAEVNAYEIERRKKAWGANETKIDADSGMSNGVLPLSSVIVETLSAVWNKRLRLFQALILVSMSLVGLELVYAYLLAPDPSLFTSMLYIIPYVILFTLFAVTCHRIVLLGNSEVPKYGILSWSQRETRFIGWTIVGYLFFTLITMFVGVFAIPVIATSFSAVFAYVIPLVVLVPGGYVLSRLSILLPATAVDERPNLKWAWNITSGNGWKLFLIVALLPQLVSAVYVFVDWPEYLIIQFAIGLLTYALVAIEIAALSVSYRFLNRKVDAV